MIKFFKNQDIQITSFGITKPKIANSLFPDLILGTDDLYEFPLVIEYEDTNLNFNSKNTSGSFSNFYTYCELYTSNSLNYLGVNAFNPDEYPTFQKGLKYKTNYPFYTINDPNYNSSLNPVNTDGTYQGQVYNTTKNMYYNNYNNCYNIFGVDGFNNSFVNLNLQDSFITYQLNVTQSGDRIRPLSININNQTGDIVTSIKDDGNYNLYLSGSFFVDNFESYSKNTDNVINPCIYGIGKYLCDGTIVLNCS
jgi:hypothetical protein